MKGAVKHEYDQKLAEFRAELEVLNRISQERWHMKRDVFVRALRLIDSWWSNIDWSNVEPDRQDKPDIQEIRMVHNQLSLICESREVMGAFQKCLRAFKPEQLQDLSMDAIADLRSAMRKELKFTEEISVDREFSWVALGSSLFLTLAYLVCYKNIMSRPLRIEYKDAWYHAMNRGRNREVIFHDKYDYRMFVELLKETSKMWNFHISAYCLMPNHYHLLIQTPDANLSRGMRHINGLYTQRYNRRHGCDGPLFKGRYKSVLVGGDDYLLQALRYIHKNPVKAGIVDAPAKYTWSSHKGYLSAAEKWNWLYKTTLLSMLSPNRKNCLKMYKNFMRDKSDVFYSEIIERKRWPVCYGISEFVDWIKGSYYARKIDDDIPQSKELAPDETLIIKCVCEYYKVTNDTLIKSKRGEFNEPRNIAIYLFRTLRHDSLKIIGESFNIRKYYTVSSVISRLKQLLKKDKIIKKRIESVKDLINKYQEQT